MRGAADRPRRAVTKLRSRFQSCSPTLANRWCWTGERGQRQNQGRVRRRRVAHSAQGGVWRADMAAAGGDLSQSGERGEHLRVGLGPRRAEHGDEPHADL